MPRIGIVVNRPSESARTLAEALDCNRLRPKRVSVVGRRYRRLINWGCSDTFSHLTLYNPPSAISIAKDKAFSFMRMGMRGVNIPRNTVDINEARNFSFPILARTRRGSGGEGISVIRQGSTLPNAELYVEYIPKNTEYRVHVAFGRSIFVQQKRRRSDTEQTRDQKLIRNHSNGWVFCEENVDTPPQSVIDEAIKAVASLDLDFGAVDIILHRDTRVPYVLEVNTAPGIESTRLKEAYANSFDQV